MSRYRSSSAGHGDLLMVALLGLGVIALLIWASRNQSTASTTAQPQVRLAEVASQPQTPQGLVRYRNTETRELEWDFEHMVPTKITIHRESVQVP